jgi:WD40 repeat protein
MCKRQLISRRGFIRGAWLSVAVGLSRGQTRPDAPDAESPIRLVKEIKYAGFRDVSLNSSKYCFYFSHKPIRSFRQAGVGFTEKRDPATSKDNALKVLDASWEPVYAVGLPTHPARAVFFEDGQALYAEIPGVGGGGSDRVLIDLTTGGLTERLEHTKSGYFFEYWALEDRALLGSSRNARLNRAEFLIRAEAPDFHEVLRVPFAGTRLRPDSPREADIVVSSDRSAFVYAYDSTVVCRDAKNLEALWSHAGDPQLPVWKVGISANSEVVVAAAADTLYIGGSTKHFVTVFSGNDGRALTTIPALGTEGVAVSPDGKILAAGQRIPLHDKKVSGTQPTVVLFEIASGKKLGTIVHDQFYEGGGEFLHAGVNAAFTPNGRYLITSGLNTKIWQISNG